MCVCGTKHNPYSSHLRASPHLDLKSQCPYTAVEPISSPHAAPANQVRQLHTMTETGFFYRSRDYGACGSIILHKTKVSSHRGCDTYTGGCEQSQLSLLASPDHRPLRLLSALHGGLRPHQGVSVRTDGCSSLHALKKNRA